MSRKLIIKIVVDLCMTVLILLLMSYSLVGEVVHEWLGMAMLVFLILHGALNAGWIRGLRKGRYSAFRIVQTASAALALLSMLGSMLSGIAQSRYVFAFLPLRELHTLAETVHLPCAYWSFLFVSLHLGFHWSMVLGVMRRMTGAASPSLRTFLLRLTASLIAIYGAISFSRNNIFSYLLLRTHFLFFDFDQTPLSFFAEYLSIMGTFVFLAYYIGRLLQKNRRQPISGKGESA